MINAKFKKLRSNTNGFVKTQNRDGNVRRRNGISDDPINSPHFKHTLLITAA